MTLSFYKSKKVFVTGHTGFKGTWLCHILLNAGADITGYALEPPTNPSLFEQTGLAKKIHSITGDIRNRDMLVRAIQKAEPDILLHLAAQPLVRLSYQQPAVTYETNVMGTVNILEAARHTPSIRSVVNVTTDKVYENKEWHWGYRENENLCGFDPYSNSKSCSELVTTSYRNSFFSTDNIVAISTARSGNVIGGGDYAIDRIIPDCIRSVMDGKKIILRNPHSIRPYQHVLDCLAGYLILAKEQYDNPGLAGAYNFGPKEESCVTNSRLAELFCLAWGESTWTVQNDNGPHEAGLLKLDCSKAKAILKWEQHWNIETAIEKVTKFARCKDDIERIYCLNNQIKEYFG
jgi:CDP-glucose 4,6-dehydratase